MPLVVLRVDLPETIGCESRFPSLKTGLKCLRNSYVK